jgi:hypothetical protein
MSSIAAIEKSGREISLNKKSLEIAITMSSYD